MQIKLEQIVLRNFKGCKERTINFADKTNIYGANATGKTTVLDSFMWLSFDKDSTGATKFQIRPLDSDGNQINNVEIAVEGTLNVDGKSIVLKKVQRQKWVKKRGSEATELQGNENLYEINGYPKSEKDYKEYISDLINEELFKLITNPQAFSSMPWKKQREVLMKLVDDISDIDIALQNPDFAVLVPELEMASPEDIRKKYTKALNTWKKKQDEIPARIDELSRQKVDIDTAELELQKNLLKEQIVETEQMQNDSQAAVEAHDKAYNEVMRIKGEMRQISGKAESLLLEQKRTLQSQKDEAQCGFNESRQHINMLELDIKQCEKQIEQLEDKKKQYQDLWRKEKAKTFEEYVELPALNEEAMICPTCGQALPEEQKQQQIESYEERKKKHYEDYLYRKDLFKQEKENNLKFVTDKGNATVANIKEKKEKLEKIKNELVQAKEDSMKFNKLESEAMEELAKLPLYPDMSDDQEYESLELELAKALQALNSMSSGADYRNQLRIKLSGLREELSTVEKKIASTDNSIVEKRIEELEEEQREVGQKVADQEKMIDLLEKFIRVKMERISSLINAKFNTVNFKLFDMQINGGMKECCECTVNGVPYSSLNNGHKIIAGLDIISSLCELYEITAPVFIDNAEALNDFNIPKIDGQMILLRVSDDKELRVEVTR